MTISAIRQADFSDLPKIQCFIGKNWKKDHVLTKDLVLFNHLYSYPDSRYLNFFLCEDSNKHLLGILGYIRASQFDPQIPTSSDILWYSIWQAIESKSNSLVGLRLMAEVSKRFKTIRRGTVGANISTLPIYKALGYKTGTLSTYYAVNHEQPEQSIIRNINRCPDRLFGLGENSCTIKSMKRFEELEAHKAWVNTFAKSHHSFKTFDYIRNRYANHPRFKYCYWEIDSLESKLIIISRKVFLNSSSLIRIVDLIGDERLFQFFTQELRSKVIGSSEYIEFRCSGLNDELVDRAGFRKLDPKSGIVIPGYYDPIAFQNKDIHWSVTSGFDTLHGSAVIVVGDCDQDRPNTFNSEHS